MSYRTLAHKDHSSPSLILPCWSLVSGQQMTYLLHLPSFPALLYYAIQKAAQPQASHFSEDRDGHKSHPEV